jgi:hypothetical protein
MSSTPARRAASELRRRGLAVPARLLADAHRPLAPLLSDLGAALGPLLGPLAAGRPGRVLADEALLDDLVAELDATGGAR